CRELPLPCAKATTAVAPENMASCPSSCASEVCTVTSWAGMGSSPCHWDRYLSAAPSATEHSVPRTPVRSVHVGVFAVHRCAGPCGERYPDSWGTHMAKSCRPDVSEREDLSTHRTQSRQWVRSGVADDEPGRSVHRFTECAPHDDEVSHAPGRTHRHTAATHE